MGKVDIVFFMGPQIGSALFDSMIALWVRLGISHLINSRTAGPMAMKFTPIEIVYSRN